MQVGEIGTSKEDMQLISTVPNPSELEQIIAAGEEKLENYVQHSDYSTNHLLAG